MKACRYIGLALISVAQAGAATVLSCSRSGNQTFLELDTGAAEIEFLTENSFRMRRAFIGRLPDSPRAERLKIPVKFEEAPTELIFGTRSIEVAVQKPGLLVSISRSDGRPVLADVKASEYVNGAVRVERAPAGSPAFYGLGARANEKLNARGTVVRAGVPFLYSTAGYGEYYASPAAYTFDLALTNRYLVEARGPGYLDYYFYFGPNPRDVFEELQTSGVSLPVPAPAPVEGTWTGLRTALVRLMHACFSGLMQPTLDDVPWRGKEQLLTERADQLAALINGRRPELEPYRFAYAQEVRDRGLPPIRPLPFHFPLDMEAPKHADEFMYGDELLVSPLLSPTVWRSVYLPMGIWTRLDTNEVFQGSRTIKIEAAGLPLFARNGSIVPLQFKAMQLHYFPKLGAEFFIFENEAGEYSQVHAGPAADVIRLEIESARDRDYEWVIHNVHRPMEVSFEGRKYADAGNAAGLSHETWHYERSKGNLHIWVHVRPGEDRITNVIF